MGKGLKSSQCKLALDNEWNLLMHGLNHFPKPGIAKYFAIITVVRINIHPCMHTAHVLNCFIVFDYI
jgi:hypothetical protein